jgi:hypothetical protein
MGYGLGAVIPVEALAEISIDGLSAVTWILALVVGLAMYLWHPRKRLSHPPKYLRHARKLLGAALGAVATFIAANVASGIYVVAHPRDPRWSDDAPLSAPSLSDAPMIGQHLEPLDSLMDDVVARINDLRDFQQAVPVALDFFTAAGWGCLAGIPLAFFALAASYGEKKRQKEEFAGYKKTIEDLQHELDDVKRFVNYRD